MGYISKAKCMRPVEKGRERNLGWFQIPVWICRWLTLLSTETEMRRVELGRGEVVWAKGKELRSSSLNMKCPKVIYLGLSRRLLVSLWTRDVDFGVLSKDGC